MSIDNSFLWEYALAQKSGCAWTFPEFCVEIELS
jgi:hypothetical protein